MKIRLLALALLLAACSDPAAVHVARGNVLQNSGRLADALSEYQAAVAAKPTQALARERKADMLLALGRGGEAKSEYVLAAQFDQRSITALLSLAKLETDRGDLRLALAYLDNAHKRQPRNAYALLSHGNLALKSGDARAALGSFAQVLELEPHNAPALYGSGNALLAAGDLDGAEKAFARLHEQFPTNPGGLYGRAKVRMARGDKDGALADLKAALALSPEQDVRKDPAFAALADDPAFQALTGR